MKIVIFGEIIPQSVCVRHGLPIGAYLSPFVLVLMYILAPIAWPTARLLDRLLGEDHGTVYKKAGLKTLVTLHKTLGPSPSDRLNQDEVTIISAVLDLKDKAVGDIMTPMDDVYTMSSDTILDEETMDEILDAGYSRIPIHAPGNPYNFVGMLLVKILITYDPEDCCKVSDFNLATLPETATDTSCLDIVNFFQEGKSHMVLVSEYPGENFGALGVVTLEDVIEELIGEEIIDESDVFIDVHKAIRRLNPAPKARIARGYSITGSIRDTNGESKLIGGEATKTDSKDNISTIRTGDGELTLVVSNTGSEQPRRRSRSSLDGAHIGRAPRPKIAPEMKEQFKHLGPSNQASRPRTTKVTTVKIKGASGPDGADRRMAITDPEGISDSEERTALLKRPASIKSLTVGHKRGSYGALDSTDNQNTKAEQVGATKPTGDTPKVKAAEQGEAQETEPLLTKISEEDKTAQKEIQVDGANAELNDHVASPSVERQSSSELRQRLTSPSGLLARSGSLVESEIVVDGIRKVVVNVSSSSSENEADGSSSKKPTNQVKSDASSSVTSPTQTEPVPGDNAPSAAKKKKRRGKKKKASQT
jgi:metal transporter CNNM